MRKNIILIILLLVGPALASLASAQSLVPVSATSVAVTVKQEGEKIVNGSVVERYFSVNIGNTSEGEARENSILYSRMFSLWARDAIVYTKIKGAGADTWQLEIFSMPSNTKEILEFRSNPPDSWHVPKFYNKAKVRSDHLPMPLNSAVLRESLENLKSVTSLVEYKEGGIKVFLEGGTIFEADTFAEKIRDYLSRRKTG